MEYKFLEEKSDKLQKAYEITVEAEEYEPIVDNIYGFLAIQIGVDLTNMSPEDGLKIRYGDKYAFEVAKCLCEELTDKLIEQEGIPAAMVPSYEGIEDFHRGETFTFTAIVDTKPELTLSSYDPVELMIPDYDITDKVIDDYIAKELDDKAKLERDEEATKVTDGTYVLISVDTKKYTMQVGPLCAKEAPYKVGDPDLPDIYDEKLKAMKPGDVLEFEFDITSKNFLNMDVTEHMKSRLELHSILKKEKVVLDDEWVKKNVPGAHDIKSYREVVRKNLNMQGEEQKHRMIEQSAMSTLSKRLEEYELPAEYYEFSRAGLLQNMSAAFEKSGMTADEFYERQGINRDQFMIQMLVRGRQVLHEGLALESLARKLGLEIEEDDINRALSQIAPGDEPDARKMLEMNGRLYQLREMAIRLKARRHLIENAKITYVVPDEVAAVKNA